MSELIDRQAAIDAIRASTSKYTGFMEMEMYTDDDAVEAIEAVPAASPWHRSEEPPKKTGKYAVCWTYQEKIYWDWLIFHDGKWELHAGFPMPDYWMPIEPPKEDA